MMRCVICGLGPADGVSVYRINEKGQPGIWACEKHTTPKPELTEIVKVLEDANHD